MHTIKRGLCLLLACSLLVGGLVYQAPQASAYMATKPLPELTGNTAQDVANVAISQLGYHEVDGGTAYGAWWGSVSGWGDYTYLGWCSMFVNWCAYQAGAGMDIAYNRYSAIVSSSFSFLKSNGTVDRSFGTTPMVGDFIYFGRGDSFEHVAVVVGYDSKTNEVTFVGGNQGNAVSQGTVAWSSSAKWGSQYILGYGRPNYDGVVDSKPEDTMPDETVPDETVPEETDPQEPAAPAPEKETAVKGIVTSDDGLRIRAQAGTSYAIVGYLRYQQEVKILERKTVDGRPWGRMEKGWVCLDYVRLQDSTSEMDPPKDDQKPVVQNGTITGSNLRIRSGPSTAYQILGYLQIGDRVEITETVTTGTTQWGKISKGWISMDYVKLSGAVETPDKEEKPSEEQKPSQEQKPNEEQKPSENQKPDQEKPAKGQMGTITGDALRIRTGAGTNHQIIGFLYTGDRVEILEQKTVGSTTWGKISKGWISMDYVKLDAAQQEQKLTATVKEGNLLRIRNGAGSDFTVVGYLYEGDTVEILERKIVDGTHWGRCEQGWVNLTYVTMSDGSATEPKEDDATITGTVTATALNVRKAAGVGNQIVSVLYQGDRVTILETTVVGSTTWGRTDKGWISMDYVR